MDDRSSRPGVGPTMVTGVLPPFHPDRPTLVAPAPAQTCWTNARRPAQARGREWRRTSPAGSMCQRVSFRRRRRSSGSSRPNPCCCTAVSPAGVLFIGLSCRWFDGMERDGATPRTASSPPATSTSASSRASPSARRSSIRAISSSLTGSGSPRRCGRSVPDALTRPNAASATVALDMAMFSDAVSTAEVAVYAAAHSRWTGIPQARDAIPCTRTRMPGPRRRC